MRHSHVNAKKNVNLFTERFVFSVNY